MGEIAYYNKDRNIFLPQRRYANEFNLECPESKRTFDLKYRELKNIYGDLIGILNLPDKI